MFEVLVPAVASIGVAVGLVGPRLSTRRQRDRAADRKARDQAEPELTGKPIAADMLTTSASGLDPDISPAYAALQVRWVAAVRGLTEERISAVLARHVAGRTLGIFGEPRVNVFELNLDLQNAYPAEPKH
jgi:K+-transporting ATPase ATPase C chain